MNLMNAFTTRAVPAVAAGLLAAPALGQVSPNWHRHPALSPDGSTIIFSHAGDLYTVPTSGGRAVPLTVHEAYETRPVWSPDGSMIAFASDRYGNFDVFVMPATGGEATRLTFNSADDLPSDFTADGGAVIFESARLDDVESVVFPSGVLAELYSVPVAGGTPDMLLTTPAINARDAGARIIYEDRKGYEDEHRKHHTSSVARDIWVYDPATGEHTQLTTHAAEDRDPHLASDGSVYFLSERAGDFNIFRMPLGDEDGARQLTFFEDHPVRHLSRADDGAMAFSWHGDIYAMAPGGPAERIDIDIAVDTAGDEPRMASESRGASDFAVSPSGKEIAFILRGEVFVTSVDFGTTVRITDTPEQERSVDFAPDGRSIVYAGERGGSWNIYRASIADEDEQYFFSATKFEEEALLDSGDEEFQPKFSPDGEKLAYLHNRSTLKVLDLASGETVTALPGTAFYSYSDGDYAFDWSPDSRWLTMHYYARGRAFVNEVGIVKADGSMSEPMNLTNSGYDDSNPSFAFEGGAILWASDRYGERSHGSWGAESDVIAAFLAQDAYDRFTLSKEEYELKKEREEKAKKDEGDDDEENGDDEAAEEEDEEVEPIEINLDGVESRTMRLTINSSALGDFALTPDGDKLFYLAQFEEGYDLWVHDFRERSTKILKKLGAGGASMHLSDDGKSIFLGSGGGLSKIDADSGEQTTISFNAEMTIDGAGERAYLFDHVWRQVREKWYDPNLHGVDWAFYRAQYEPKLEGVRTNRDFAILLSEMLGELNGSHTGARYRPGSEAGDASTASLGVFYDNDFAGPGMRIAEIMEGGPLDKAELDIEAGMTIVAVDGVRLGANTNFYRLLNNKAGDRVRLTLAGDDGEFDEVVQPVSGGAENQLRYDRWVRTRRELVNELSGGRLAYMHVRGMNDSSYRDFYGEVLGRHFDKEALIVDTRFNGGGWLHDDLATFLTGTRYVDLHPRDDESPDVFYHGDTSWRWTKPSAVVMSEGNYSDAHFFPWVYTQLNIGPTVGMPVPGTATAVWWEGLHTGDIVFGIPQVGTKGMDGAYLENQQLEPTFRVPLPPEAAAAGEDTQVQAAVEALLEMLDEEG